MSFAAIGVGGAVTAGIGLAGNVASGAIQAGAAGSAADKQAAASRYATDLQNQQYQQTRADQEPWRQAGATAISQMQNPDFQKTFGAGDFQKDPGYDFRMQQGQQALERSAAARGGLGGGGFAKALSRYGQDYASNEYQNAYNRFNSDQSSRFNRLSSLAGMGQTANTALGTAGANYANQAGSNAMGAANAAGAAGIAQGNAWGGTLSGIGKTIGDTYAQGQQNNWMKQWLSNQTPASSGGSNDTIPMGTGEALYPG